MNAEIQHKSPFNYVQVLITSLGAGYLNVIAYFIGEASGASMFLSGGPVEHVEFAQVLGYTIAPIMVLALLPFLIGRAKPGFGKFAQWLGLAIAVLSIASPVVFAADLATGITLSIMHVIVGIAWFFAVHRSNMN